MRAESQLSALAKTFSCLQLIKDIQLNCYIRNGEEIIFTYYISICLARLDLLHGKMFINQIVLKMKFKLGSLKSSTN